MTRSSLGYVIVLAGVLAACGGDDSGKKDNASTGKAGNDKSSEKDGTTLPCGSMTCKLPGELKGEELCCKDQFSGGTCGVKVGAECRPIPKIDERCPVPQIMVNFPGGASGMRAFGCCTTGGECGIDFGQGCMPRTVACMVVNQSNKDQVMPQKCTGEPLPLPETCGMGGFPFPGAAAGGGG